MGMEPLHSGKLPRQWGLGPAIAAHTECHRVGARLSQRNGEFQITECRAVPWLVSSSQENRTGQQEVGQGCGCWPGTRTPRQPAVGPLLRRAFSWGVVQKSHPSRQLIRGGRVGSQILCNLHSSQQDGKHGETITQVALQQEGLTEGGTGQNWTRTQAPPIWNTLLIIRILEWLNKQACVSGQGTERAAAP